MSKIEDEIYEIVLPIVVECDCYIYDVEFKKEGADWFLRIFIDGEHTGVSLNECEIVSRGLSQILDKNDPIDHAYFLEVSSPGIDRKLTRENHFTRNMGKFVDVKLFKPKDGVKIFTGLLCGYNEFNVEIVNDEEKISFSKPEIAFVRLHVDI